MKPNNASHARSSVRLPATRVLLWTLCFGLAAGFGEQLFLFSSRYRPFFAFNPDSLWMVPVVDVLWVGVPGLLLALTAARFPDRVGYRGLAATLALFAWLPVVMTQSRLHLAAAVILSSGLAVVTGRVANRWPRVFHRVIRLGTVCLVIAVPTLAMAPPILDLRKAQQSDATRPLAPAESRNVLVILIDTGRASHFSLYGYERTTTPWLDSWAQEAIVFDHAIAPSSWTLPTHATIFTGRLPNTILPRRIWPLEDTYPTLAEALAAEGYSTGAFFANVEFGHPLFGLGQGFDHYDVFGVSLGEFVLSSSIGRFLHLSSVVRRLTGYDDLIARRNARDINAAFMKWQRSIEGRPFFAFLNYYDTHLPYLPPDEFAERFSLGQDPDYSLLARDHRSVWVPFGSSVSRDELQDHIDAYDGAIAYVDDQMRSLVQAMDSLGALRNTVVIITSDHGEAFGEHGFADHGRSLYEPEIHVPLIIWQPQNETVGIRVEEGVTLQDLPETILDLAGIPNRQKLPGNTLARYWNSSTPQDTSVEPVIAQLRAWRDERVLEMVISEHTKYIRTFNERGDLIEEQVFRLDHDLGEQTNLVGTPSADTTLTRLRAALDSVIQSNTTPKQGGQ